MEESLFKQFLKRRRLEFNEYLKGVLFVKAGNCAYLYYRDKQVGKVEYYYTSKNNIITFKIDNITKSNFNDDVKEYKFDEIRLYHEHGVLAYNKKYSKACEINEIDTNISVILDMKMEEN